MKSGSGKKAAKTLKTALALIEQLEWRRLLSANGYFTAQPPPPPPPNFSTHEYFIDEVDAQGTQYSVNSDGSGGATTQINVNAATVSVQVIGHVENVLASSTQIPTAPEHQNPTTVARDQLGQIFGPIAISSLGSANAYGSYNSFTFNLPSVTQTETLHFSVSNTVFGTSYGPVPVDTSMAYDPSGTYGNFGLTIVFNRLPVAPSITSQPSSQTVTAGQTATFAAAASGTPTPTVQWQVSSDGGSSFSNIGGATSTTYSFTAQQGQNGYQYRAVFSNSGGTATTSAATLQVNPATVAPTITSQPSSQGVTAGQTATFSAAASGNPTPSVQWQVSANGGGTFSNISGATSTTYSFTAQQSQNGYQYRAVFSNTAGTATSSAAVLTVAQAPVAPTVTQQPANQSVVDGQTATFSADASGYPTPTVQWQVSSNGGGSYSNIAGATAATYSFAAQQGQSGNKYRAMFTNSAGVAFSNAASLTVSAATVPPAITAQPGPQNVVAGQTATFTAAASGTPTPSVQWQVSTDGGNTFSNLSGATSTTYSFTAQQNQNGDQFRAVFSNTAGTATSGTATLAVAPATTAPTITTQPSSQGVIAGQTAVFTAAASGNPMPTIQWQVSTDGGSTFSNIAGATGTALSVTTSADQNHNLFRAVFTNSAGTATTNAATLTVSPVPVAPAITVQPTSQSVVIGQTASFVADASGSPTPNVQWQFSSNGGKSFNNIPGAISPSYAFPAQASQNGYQYRAVFSNSAGSATTGAASLSVSNVGTQPGTATPPAAQQAGLAVGTLSGKFPPNALTGQLLRPGSVRVTNVSGQSIKGPLTIVVYAWGATQAGSGLGTPLLTLTRVVSIKAGAARTFLLPAVRLPTAPDTYYLLASASASGGALSGNSDPSPAIAVATPLKDLSVVSPAVVSSVLRKRPTLTVTVVNDGNVPAAGIAKIAVYASQTGALDNSVLLATVPLHVNLKPGQVRTYQFSFRPIIAVPPAATTLLLDLSFTGEQNADNNLVAMALS